MLTPDPALVEAAERHADQIDKATAIAEESLRLAIEAAKAGASAPLPAIGKCHYCEEPLEEGLRFCDEFCREDYDYITARNKANAIRL